jgi:hypothetical protein
LILEKFKVANIPDKMYHYRYVSNSFSRLNLHKDFKKYYIREICFFLKDQRNKNGKDGLMNIDLKDEMNTYLLNLEMKFQKEQPRILVLLINRSIGNGDVKTAVSLLKEAIINRINLRVNDIFNLFYGFLKHLIRRILN